MNAPGFLRGVWGLVSRLMPAWWGVRIETSLEELVAAGADVRARAPSGRTALHAAAEFGFADVVRTLAAASADLNAATHNGQTALMAAAAAGNATVVEALLSEHADAALRDSRGRTAHGLAESYPKLWLRLEGVAGSDGAVGDAREERDGRSAEAESGEVPQRRVNLSVRHAHQHEEDDFYSREAEADDLSKPYA